MNKIPRFFCIAIISLASATPGLAQPSGIPWIHFQWDSLKTGGKTYAKSALLVPVRIRSFPQIYYMQLDTGAFDTIFYAVPKKVQDALLGDWHKGQPFYLPLHIGDTLLTLSGIRITTLSADMKGPYPIIGTLGLNALLNFAVFIDFAHQRIAFIRPQHVRPSDIAGVSFVHITYRNDKIFIPITIDRVRYKDDFFYDSGSSLFSLSTRRSLWSQLTGRSPDDQRNEIMRVNQWNKTATVIGAKIHGVLSIGPINIPSAVAWVQTSGGTGGALVTANYPVKGVIGNAPFYNCCMIVIDIPEQRFGITRSGLLPGQ
ncbi:MAG: hypothetical protein ACRER1_02895 [Gammaproteobacteria bacterium]